MQNVQTFPGHLHLVRIHAPFIAQHALPGQVVSTPDLTHPLPIVRRSAASGQVELLYHSTDENEHASLDHIAGKHIRVAGLIGNAFHLNSGRQRPLIIGDDSGIAAAIFLACDIAHQKLPHRPFVILGASASFPFTPAPSKMLAPSMPAGVIAAMPLLDDLQIANRLVSPYGLPGCFEEDIAHLARHWLNALALTQHSEIEIFVSGSQTTRHAVIALAKELDLPYQVALEDNLV